MSAEVARVLRDAADLIEPPGRWTKGTGARRSDGRPTFPTDPDAVCWCAVGATNRAAEGRFDQEILANARLRTITPDGLIGKWNDAQESVEPVVAALRAAADEVEASS